LIILGDQIPPGREPAWHRLDHGHPLCSRYDLWSKLAKLLRECPGIKVELIIDYGLTDIVPGL
jgi:hypothetical protein